MFQCRTEAWLQAEGIIRKRRRQRGELEDSETLPLPKPEPAEERVPADEPMGGAEVIGSSPQPRSLTPLSYADEEQAVQDTREMTHSTSEPTGQEQQPALSGFLILERPRKIRRLRNFTFTTDGETRKTTSTGTGSGYKPLAEGGSESKVKVEGDSQVAEVEIEEGRSVLGIKEVGGIKHEEFNGLLKVCASSTRFRFSR